MKKNNNRQMPDTWRRGHNRASVQSKIPVPDNINACIVYINEKYQLREKERINTNLYKQAT
jgi:hypothetical protein